MNRRWLYTSILISLTLLCLVKAHNLKSLQPYFKSSPVLKLKNFEDARKLVSKKDLEYLKLWESILTGRAAPLPKLMKERYSKLGLNHIFTPSGFHLSAVLFPFMKLIKVAHYQLIFLMLIGSALLTLPGFMALKRMVLIKSNQKIFGMKSGFIAGLMLDMLFGSFSTGVLSFSYSFLFLSIVYSGLRGVGLIIWFFIAQMILAYFQNADISPLILLFSPIVNLSFTILMPLLFLLAIPLWNWQLHCGIFLLKALQFLVDVFSSISTSWVLIEMNFLILFMIVLLIMRKWKLLLLALLLNSNSLNPDHARNPGLPTKEFAPQGELVKTIYREKDVLVYFRDGKCKLRLVRGLWWENCSPLRRSSWKN